MPPKYTYRILKSGKPIGILTTMHPIRGMHLRVPVISEFKRVYGKNYPDIIVPIKIITTDDGVFIRAERTLDVSKKGKKQIAFLLGIGIL